MSADAEVTPSCGCVFCDLGFKPDDHDCTIAAEKRKKAAQALRHPNMVGLDFPVLLVDGTWVHPTNKARN